MPVIVRLKSILFKIKFPQSCIKFAGFFYLIRFIKTTKCNLHKLYFSAAGIYYIAELVEEYTVIAKKTIRSLIIFDVVIYCLFIFTENFSWSMIVFGLLAQLVHNLILRNFPFVKFISIEFLLAIVILLINHYFAFNYFQENFYSISEVSCFL